MPTLSLRGNLPPPVAGQAADQRTPSQGTGSSQSSMTSSSSSTPGCGTGCKWWFNKLSSMLIRGSSEAARSAAATSATHLLAADDDVPSCSAEAWEHFFAEQFNAPAFSAHGMNGKIDPAAFKDQKTAYVSSLHENAKGKALIHVLFHDLPECRADRLSSNLVVREPGTMPKHVSMSLIRATLNALNDLLRTEAGKERSVHIDFSRKPAQEYATHAHAGSSAQARSGFMSLPFRDTLNAMAHFGTLLPEFAAPEIRNIPGLRVTADLSGLKIESPEDLNHLHNLIIRSTFAGVHVDMSLIDRNDRNLAWASLARTLQSPGAQYLRDLTLTLPAFGATASPGAAQTLARALSAPACHLHSLAVNGDDWSDEAKALLLDAVKTRQDMGQPITITIDGQQLEPNLQ